MASSALTIYGHWVSQPARSVLWLLKIKELPFDFKKVEPMNGDTRKEDFRALFPTAKAPAIIDEGDFRLAEGSAILGYLCDKHKWVEWYPSELQERARVNEYLSSHHTTSRLITRNIFHPIMLSIMKPDKPEPDLDILASKAQTSASRFSSTWLEQGPYIGGFQSPTIADLMAYCEFAQAPQMRLLDKFDDPKIEDWLSQMQSLPYHDDVHRSLFKLSARREKLANK